MNKLVASLESTQLKAIGEVVSTLLYSGARSATKYLGDKLTIRASLKLFDGKMPSANEKQLEIALVIGPPNYEAREFIKVCKKAGETFPIKKIQLKFPAGRK
jgi:hypothetical protein